MSSVTERIQAGKVECAICHLQPHKIMCKGWFFVHELAFCPVHKECKAAKVLAGAT